jgi:ribosome-associated toxin RatA of RatAB toxin-antitoxin module
MSQPLPSLLVRLCVVVASLLVTSSGGSAEDDTQSRLAKDEILISTRPIAGSDLPEVTAQAVFQVPPEKLWKVIDNCGNYKNTMERIIASKELERKGNRVVCEVTVGLPFPLSDLHSVTEAVHVVGPPKWTRTWKLLRGDFDRNDGSWTLTPFAGDANRTLAVYRLHTEPRTHVPLAILRRGQRESLPKLIEKLRGIVK